MNQHMRNTEADLAISETVALGAQEEVRQFVERYEHLEAEGKDITEQQKEVLAEAKGRGYSVKALRAVVKMRKMDRDDLAEFEAIVDLYRTACGV